MFSAPESTTGLTKKLEFQNEAFKFVSPSQRETVQSCSQSVSVNYKKEQQSQKAPAKGSLLFLNQIRYEGLVSYIKNQIKYVSAIYWHYEILSLILVIIAHQIQLDNEIVISICFCFNVLANSFYATALFQFTESRCFLVFMCILKVATFPLPMYSSSDLTETNSLYDVMFCMYLHRFYYLIHLMAYYSQAILDRKKQVVFKRQFTYDRVVKRRRFLERYGEKIWNELKEQNGRLSRQLTDSVNEEIAQERVLHVKQLLHYRPFALTTFLIVFSTFVLSYAFQQAETQVYNESYAGAQGDVKDVRYFPNDLYVMSITIRTIGYGDISPKSMLGKVLACVASLWGLFFTSIALYIFNTYFTLSKEEKAQHGIYSESEEAESQNITEDEQINVRKYTNLISDLSDAHAAIDRNYQVSDNEIFISKIKSSNMFQRLMQIDSSQ